MVTHLGSSQHCGHYTAIGQAPNGNYYQFDDSSVRPLPLSAVLGTNAYIMFFEKDNSSNEEITTYAEPTASTVYGPQLPDGVLNRDKSPLKLTFYRNEERKPNLVNSSDRPESSKSDAKPIILNSTLIKSSTVNNSNSEPWVVKQNGEVEKVNIITKILNGTNKVEDDKKISFVIKRPPAEDASKTKVKADSPVAVGKNNQTAERAVAKPVRAAKSPLERLEEQMHNNMEGGGRLVPYECGSDEERPSRVPAAAWTVRTENRSLLSPSLQGDTTNRYGNKYMRAPLRNSPVFLVNFTDFVMVSC